MQHLCDCIIPFYNEGERILHVLSKVTNSKSISNIFAVDDGSTDNASHVIKKTYPQVRVIKLPKNLGKARAIQEGLKQVTSKYVLLLDGDLKDIHISELEDAIHMISTHEEIDMILLRRVRDRVAVKPLRHDIIMSGQRILKTSDLKNVLKETINDYQIEMAINNYMLENNKKVNWMPFSITQVIKTTKWGYRKGAKRSLQMWKEFIAYKGFSHFIKQTLFFAHKEAKDR